MCAKVNNSYKCVNCNSKCISFQYPALWDLRLRVKKN